MKNRYPCGKTNAHFNCALNVQWALPLLVLYASLRTLRIRCIAHRNKGKRVLGKKKKKITPVGWQGGLSLSPCAQVQQKDFLITGEKSDHFFWTEPVLAFFFFFLSFFFRNPCS